MINIFKKKRQLDNNQLIDQIHEEFYTEVDRLLVSAMNPESTDTDKGDIIDKHNRLRSLGFSQTEEMESAKNELTRLDAIAMENKEKSMLTEAILYFNQKYPQYKFITEDSVKTICRKYNLIYGNVSNYKGTVPDKNLKMIEDFKIDRDDMCYQITTDRSSPYRNDKIVSYSKYRPQSDFGRQNTETSHYFNTYTSIDKCKFEIVAPVKDFDTQLMEIKDFKLSNIEVKDPVVLQPVVYNNKKYYLIVTAWGQEASDPLVVNQRMN